MEDKLVNQMCNEIISELLSKDKSRKKLVVKQEQINNIGIIHYKKTKTIKATTYAAIDAKGEIQYKKTTGSMGKSTLIEQKLENEISRNYLQFYKIYKDSYGKNNFYGQPLLYQQSEIAYKLIQLEMIYQSETTLLWPAMYQKMYCSSVFSVNDISEMPVDHLKSRLYFMEQSINFARASIDKKRKESDANIGIKNPSENLLDCISTIEVGNSYMKVRKLSGKVEHHANTPRGHSTVIALLLDGNKKVLDELEQYGITADTFYEQKEYCKEVYGAEVLPHMEHTIHFYEQIKDIKNPLENKTSMQEKRLFIELFANYKEKEEKQKTMRNS